MKTYTFNRAQLVAALAKWETAARTGETTRTHEETRALPVEQVAQESADTLIGYLEEGEFPLGAACDLSGEGGCESCQ
jgi:hypothetical protein